MKFSLTQLSSLVSLVDDAKGRKAYSDAIWVTVQTGAPGAPHE